MDLSNHSNKQLLLFSGRRTKIAAFLFIISAFIFLLQVSSCSNGSENDRGSATDTSSTTVADLMTEEKLWIAPDTSTIPGGDEGKMIRYGRTLIIHTSKYFGPNGTLSKNTNGLNCQNCHLDAGTRPYGNNLGSTASTYPKYLHRSGSIVSIPQKINECFSRSLNGTPIDTTSKEMLAYISYIKWLGKDFKKELKLAGSEGIKAPPFIDRAADPEKGKVAYELYCARCHGKDGQGQYAVDVLKDETKQQGGIATADDHYYYPPLWGDQSFNAVATLYRLSKFAGFIQTNMPYPINHDNPVLTDEQAWDIAAYVNSNDRPVKDHSKDYIVDISKKPFDFPFPPYADGFTQAQHKYGPYTDMPSAHKAH